jgi:hypothetical protein
MKGKKGEGMRSRSGNDDDEVEDEVKKAIL